MNNTQALLIALALGTSALTTVAQDTGLPASDNPRPRLRQGPPHTPPLVAVLDANHDGVIDASEIANASAALLTLDQNQDGQLTLDELRPAQPQGPGGPPWHRGQESAVGPNHPTPDQQDAPPPRRRGPRGPRGTLTPQPQTPDQP